MIDTSPEEILEYSKTTQEEREEYEFVKYNKINKYYDYLDGSLYIHKDKKKNKEENGTISTIYRNQK